MIQHYACRTDHIPSRSGAIFQRPENSAQHRLIGKHLIQRTAVEVLMLNGPGRVHHGDKLVAIIDIVLRYHRLTRHRQRLVDPVAGIVIRVRHGPGQRRCTADRSVVELHLRELIAMVP